MADYIACADAGNGGTNVAVVDKKNNLVVTYRPSIRAKASGESLGLGKGWELSYSSVVWAGHRYIVGDDILTVSRKGLERHMGDNRYANEFHQFLIALALADSGVASGSVDLTVCAPPGVFNKVKPLILERFAKFNNQATIWIDGEDKPRTWDYEQISVIPEGIGAAACFILDEKGRKAKNDSLSGNVVILDIGAYTIDALSLVNGNFNPEALDYASWENEGVDLHIRQPILKEVKKQLSDFAILTEDDIDVALRRGSAGGKYTVTLGDFEADITPLVQKYSRRYAEWIANTIGDGKFNTFKGINKVFVIAGGSYLVTEHLKDWYGDKIADPTSYNTTESVNLADLNAVGGLRFRLSRLSNKKK
jgi:hypothetical protein